MTPSRVSIVILRIWLVLAVWALGGPSLWAKDSPAGSGNLPPLRVCADPDGLPRTGRDESGAAVGLDVMVLERVAERIGRRIEWQWLPAVGHFSKLGRRYCQMVIGHPFNKDLGCCGSRELDPKWSIAYAGGQFSLVVPEQTVGISSLDDLRGQRVGFVAGTVALDPNDHELVSLPTREQLLDQMQGQQINAAFVDADFADWYLHHHPDLHLRRITSFIPPQHWNMSLTVHHSQAEVLKAIDDALRQMFRRGELEKIYTAFGVQYRNPFTNLAKRPVHESWKRIQEQGELVMSFDPANLPYSSADPGKPGFDVELAMAVAKHLDLKLRIDWIDVNMETAVGALIDQECDLAFGAAIDPDAMEDDSELADQIIYSRPYYSSGYLLVGRKGEPHVRSLAQLKQDSRSLIVGTEAGSIADYRLRQRGYMRQLFRNQLAVLDAIDKENIDYGYLWPNAGWVIHHSPDLAVEVVPGYTPVDRWDIAVAMRGGDGQLKRHVDRALGELIQSGLISRTLARYHVPHFRPMEEDQSATEVKSTKTSRSYPPVKRGLEPKMATRRRSRNPYGSLKRVQAAGLLVVGLDQNNLPFSAAHPQPQGIDYEIAGILAEALGVSLKVYWAYSSHDSYPSKLARKRFCDVMLGVVPDDRFADRVLYSQPYYLARYQYVVRSIEDVSAKKKLDSLLSEKGGVVPVAIESGVAIRGISEHLQRVYPSLEGVLQAVADDQAPVGYVVCTQGNYLAAKRWPDVLRFVDTDTLVDRFPVCAAVRSADVEMKKRIDQIMDRFAKSGRLAAIYHRWNVPYFGPEQKRSDEQ